MSTGFRAIGALGLLQLLFFLVVIPLLAFAGRGRGLPLLAGGRRALYRRVVAQLVVFGGFSAIVAAFARLAWWAPPARPLIAWGAAAGLVLLLHAALGPWRRKRIAERDPRTLWLAPEPADRPWWVALSLAAGVAEELSYRGVASMLLVRAGVPVVLVVLLVNGAFGLAHVTRGWSNAGITFALGVALHALVLASGSLFPAMAVHFAHDVWSGFTYARLLKRSAAPAQ